MPTSPRRLRAPHCLATSDVRYRRGCLVLEALRMRGNKVACRGCQVCGEHGPPTVRPSLVLGRRHGCMPCWFSGPNSDWLSRTAVYLRQNSGTLRRRKKTTLGTEWVDPRPCIIEDAEMSEIIIVLCATCLVVHAEPIVHVRGRSQPLDGSDRVCSLRMLCTYSTRATRARSDNLPTRGPLRSYSSKARSVSAKANSWKAGLVRDFEDQTGVRMS